MRERREGERGKEKEKLEKEKETEGMKAINHINFGLSTLTPSSREFVLAN